MKRIRVVLIVVLVWFSFAVPTAAQETTPQANPRGAFPSEAVNQLEAAMEMLIADHPTIPGIVVYVESPDAHYSGARGLANMSDETPLTPDYSFRIGSITKTMTAGYHTRLFYVPASQTAAVILINSDVFPSQMQQLVIALIGIVP